MEQGDLTSVLIRYQQMFGESQRGSRPAVLVSIVVGTQDVSVATAREVKTT